MPSQDVETFTASREFLSSLTILVFHFVELERSHFGMIVSSVDDWRLEIDSSTLHEAGVKASTSHFSHAKSSSKTVPRRWIDLAFKMSWIFRIYRLDWLQFTFKLCHLRASNRSEITDQIRVDWSNHHRLTKSLLIGQIIFDQKPSQPLPGGPQSRLKPDWMRSVIKPWTRMNFLIALLWYENSANDIELRQVRAGTVPLTSNS